MAAPRRVNNSSIRLVSLCQVGLIRILDKGKYAVSAGKNRRSSESQRFSQPPICYAANPDAGRRTVRNNILLSSNSYALG